MLESGRTPPNIREIDDSAPDPTAPPPVSSRTPPLKPWERVRGKAPADATTPGVTIQVRRATTYYSCI